MGKTIESHSVVVWKSTGHIQILTASVLPSIHFPFTLRFITHSSAVNFVETEQVNPSFLFLHSACTVMPPWLPTATVALAFSRINASSGPSYSSRWALPHGFSSTQLIQMAALVHCKAVIRLQHNYTVNCSKVNQGLLNSAKREGDSAVGPFCQKKKKKSWRSLSWRVSLCHFHPQMTWFSF